MTYPHTAPQERTIRSYKVLHSFESDGFTPIFANRYDVTITNLHGNEGQNIEGTKLYYENAIALLKLSGSHLRAARTLLDDADIRARLEAREATS